MAITKRSELWVVWTVAMGGNEQNPFADTFTRTGLSKPAEVLSTRAKARAYYRFAEKAHEWARRVRRRLQRRVDVSGDTGQFAYICVNAQKAEKSRKDSRIINCRN